MAHGLGHTRAACTPHTQAQVLCLLLGMRLLVIGVLVIGVHTRSGRVRHTAGQ